MFPRVGTHPLGFLVRGTGPIHAASTGAAVLTRPIRGPLYSGIHSGDDAPYLFRTFVYVELRYLASSRCGTRVETLIEWRTPTGERVVL